MLVTALVLVLLPVCGARNRGGDATAPIDLVDTEFYVRALGDRCLDFGGEASWAPGQPVFIHPCNDTLAQRVRVKEIDNTSHDVELRVQDAYCIGVKGRDRLVSEGRALAAAVRAGWRCDPDG